MKSSKIISYVIILLVGVVFLVGYDSTNNSAVNQDQAIAAVKQQFPELASYPSGDLPPTSIEAEYDGLYYVAFIQNGSGVPIISARCFSVSDTNLVLEIGSYNPSESDSSLSISPKTCQPV